MTEERKNKKFAVTYEISYVHRVVVGVTAPEAESAKQLAETAFNQGTIWDDTKEMPLLFDDYEEEEGESLSFSAEEVLEFPEHDLSVRAIKQKESAFHACRMLLDGETELARNFAEQALRHLSGQDASSAEISAQKNPIALVTLSGGVYRDTREEGGVDVEVFDFDNYHDSPADFKASLPAHFKGLAEQLGIPGDVVAQADQEFECKSCGRVYDDSQECLSDDCPSKTELLTSSEILELAKHHNLKFSLLQDGDFRGTHYLHFGYDHIYFYKDRDRDHEVTEIRAEDFLYVHPDSLGKVWRVDQPIGDRNFMNSRLWKLRDALEQVRAALPDICFAKQEGVNPDLIMHINSVLNSEDNLEEFKRVLIEAKSELPTAWANHGGVAGELLQLIGLATLPDDGLDLHEELSRFTGSEKWYEHPLQPSMTYTDGVKYFVDKTNGSWLLNIVATEYPALKEQFLVSIKAIQRQDSCSIVFADPDGHEIFSRQVEHATMVPEGAWPFYLTNNVLLLPSEY